jgi:serine/threonine protein kinase
MTVESREAGLADLLIRWEELRERGESIAVEELCAREPELADALRDQIEVLREMAPLFASALAPNLKSTADQQTSSGKGTGDASSASRSASCSSTSSNLRFHAAGGLGEVFLAHGEDLNRDVALKFIKAQRVHDPDCQRRFFQEAEITGRLEHPGIVPVYSLGHDGNGSPCYAMRFIRGRTLEDAIKEFHEAGGSGPAGRSHQLRGLIKRLVAVCNTIAYAHSRGVLHRDLKPANILLGPYGETLVVDWGLAKAVGRDEPEPSAEATLRPSSVSGSSETAAGTVVGTPAYMSPEQAEGRLADVGLASDVYSLGAVLYCCRPGRARHRSSRPRRSVWKGPAPRPPPGRHRAPPPSGTGHGCGWWR